MTPPEQRAARTVEPWEPLRDIETVANRMRRMLEETFGTFPSAITDVATWSPLVDIEETDESYIVEAEVPGVKKKDLNIELMGNELTISGSFFYRIVLAENVDADKLEAELHDRVLTVRLPKS